MRLYAIYKYSTYIVNVLARGYQQRFHSNVEESLALRGESLLGCLETTTSAAVKVVSEN